MPLQTARSMSDHSSHEPDAIDPKTQIPLACPTLRRNVGIPAARRSRATVVCALIQFITPAPIGAFTCAARGNASSAGRGWLRALPVFIGVVPCCALVSSRRPTYHQTKLPRYLDITVSFRHIYPCTDISRRRGVEFIHGTALVRRREERNCRDTGSEPPSPSSRRTGNGRSRRIVGWQSQSSVLPHREKPDGTSSSVQQPARETFRP